MDTQKEPAEKIPAIRTYFKDLESRKKGSGATFVDAQKVTVPVPKKAVVPEKKIPIPPRSTKQTLPPIPRKTETETKEKLKESLPKVVSVTKPSEPITFSTKRGVVIDNDEVSSGTIITDNQKDRFKLFPAIIAALTGWFSNTKENLTAKKVPKYTVPESTRRKGVIQKATSKTGKVETADFASIQERILKRKEKGKEPETTWSANTEPGFLLLDDPSAANISNVQMVARKSFYTAPEEITVTGNNRILESTPSIPVEVPPIQVPPPQSAPIPEPAAVPEEEPMEEIVYEEAPEEEPVAEMKTPKVRSEGGLIRSLLFSVDTNRLSLSVSGFIFVMFLVVLGGYTLFQSGDKEDPREEIFAATGILEAKVETINLNVESASELIALIKNSQSNVTETTQLAVTTTDAGPSLVSAKKLVLLLGFGVEGSFMEAISELQFGYAGSRQPFIVMKITDDITAKGGALAWEVTMNQDLSPLFGDNEEYDNNIDFVDGSLAGVDVRILKDKLGNETIIYGFNKNTLIITKNSADFTELSNLTK
jgi:hypothetical protein